eukprot:1158137-Pelagomonas_calceolata.AAC.14
MMIQHPYLHCHLRPYGILVIGQQVVQEVEVRQHTDGLLPECLRPTSWAIASLEWQGMECATAAKTSLKVQGSKQGIPRKEHMGAGGTAL